MAQTRNCATLCCRHLKPPVTYSQRRYRYAGTGGRGFYFPDRKMGKQQEMEDNVKWTTIKQMSEGIEIVKRGLPKWRDDFYDRLNFDKNFMMQHHDFEYFTKFNSDTVKQWSVTSDADAQCGKSTAQFTTTSNGKGLFSGYLHLDPVQDGYTKKAGFCNISAPPNKNHFEKEIPYEFGGYTDIALRVRGDGRNYMVVLQMDHHYSVHWYDMYHYPLFTRGGPYWQFVKIPFSKFYLTSCGRIQDNQHHLIKNRIKHIGITMSDGVEGAFQLEIDYIALLRDENSQLEDFEYEMYRKDPYVV